MREMAECVFCRIVARGIPSNRVYEDDMFVAVLDINPINPGHTLIISKEHYETIFDLPEYLLEKTAPVTKHVAVAVKRGAGATGINILMNNGRSAGQLLDHAHIHIIPRHEGDGFRHWKGTPYALPEDAEKVAAQIKNSF